MHKSGLIMLAHLEILSADVEVHLRDVLQRRGRRLHHKVVHRHPHARRRQLLSQSELWGEFEIRFN